VLISAVSGTAGVGKTALAVHWAHRVADRFPDGQLYVNLHGFDAGGTVLNPAEAVRGFLEALQVSAQRIPIGPAAQGALYRSLLTDRRMLVMLDNARDAEQVRPLLPGAPGCLVVITSRNQLAGLVATEGARPLMLDLPSHDECRELLARRLGVDRVTAEPAAVDEIIARCARLPLALAIVAARAATHPQFCLQSLAAELTEHGDRLDALTGEDPSTDVRAVFSWSYRALSPAAARLFRLLGLPPGPDIGTPAAASLAGLPIAELRPALAELTRAHLVTEHTPGRYSCHDLLRAYATELAQHTDPPDERRLATHRLLDHYMHTGYAAASQLNPYRDPIALAAPAPGVTAQHLTGHDAALDWFTAEHTVLLRAIDLATATGFEDHVWLLAWSLADFLDRQGRWADWASIQRLAMAAAGRRADPVRQAHAQRVLAVVHTRLTEYGEAERHLGQALRLYQGLGDLVGQARTQLSLAPVAERGGRCRDALQHTLAALDLFRAAGHRAGQANALSSAGWCHALLGEHEEALRYGEEAVALHRDMGDRHGTAASWDSLGYAHFAQGTHDQAASCYQQALDLYRELGDRHEEAATLINLGDSEHAADRPDAARDAWQQAVAILTDLDHPDADEIRDKLRRLDRSLANPELCSRTASNTLTC
jgi:tetratricopeptide (TPR) repeat protein